MATPYFDYIPPELVDLFVTNECVPCPAPGSLSSRPGPLSHARFHVRCPTEAASPRRTSTGSCAKPTIRTTMFCKAAALYSCVCQRGNKTKGGSLVL